MAKSVDVKYPLVLVEWKDAMSIREGWQTLEKNIDSPAICHSVGFLVADNKNVKILYATIAQEDEWTNECGKGNIIIPSKSIVSIKKLKT